MKLMFIYIPFRYTRAGFGVTLDSAHLKTNVFITEHKIMVLLHKTICLFL